MLKKKRSGEQGEMLVAEFKKSGLSQNKFAKQQGIKVASLQYWLRKLKEKKELRFVEVVARQGGSIRLELPGGAAVHFDAIPSPEYLARLALELSKHAAC